MSDIWFQTRYRWPTSWHLCWLPFILTNDGQPCCHIYEWHLISDSLHMTYILAFVLAVIYLNQWWPSLLPHIWVNPVTYLLISDSLQMAYILAFVFAAIAVIILISILVVYHCRYGCNCKCRCKSGKFLWWILWSDVGLRSGGVTWWVGRDHQGTGVGVD